MAEGSLEFEKPINELEKKIEDLRQLARQEGIEVTDELRKLEKKADKLRKDVFSRLSRWQRVQLARHPLRPYTLDYVGRLMDENHCLLQTMGVSSFELDVLVEAARHTGALGAKLSGAGRGGNMIALVTPQTCEQVKDALEEEGAQGIIQTQVKGTPSSQRER